MGKLDNFRHLWFDAFTVEDNKAWIFANNFNGLYEANLETGEARFLFSLPDEELFVQGLCFNLLKKGNNVYLIPAKADGLFIYDIATGEYKKIKIDMPIMKCLGATMYDNRIYMVGNKSARIAVYDENTEQLSYIDECVGRLSPRSDGRMAFRKNKCVVGHYYYLASCISNTVVRLDMQANRIEFVDFDVRCDGFRNIEYDGEFFWITKWDACSLIKWDGKKTYEEIDSDLDNDIFKSSDIIFVENEVFIYPTVGEYVAVYNKNSKKWSRHEGYVAYLKMDNADYPWGRQRFTQNIKTKNAIYSFYIMARLSRQKSDDFIVNQAAAFAASSNMAGKYASAGGMSPIAEWQRS